MPVDFFLFLLMMYNFLKSDRVSQILLWFAIALYIAILLELTFYLHSDVLGVKVGFDLAIFDQATWLISHGQTPFVTIRGLHILADHFSVLLYLLAPLYWLSDNCKVLLTIQTVALALGALPVFTFARERTGAAYVGLIFAAVYLLSPLIQLTNTDDFHPDIFAIPFLLVSMVYLSRGQWTLYFIALGLTLLTKETVGLTVIALGFYALFKINRCIGCLTVCFGVLSLITALSTVNYFNGGTPSGYYWLYASYGNSLPTISKYILMHPLKVICDLNTEETQQYLLMLIEPLMFLPLLSPEVLLITAPALLINLLSSRDIMHSDGGAYYSASIIPFLFIAAIIGYARLERQLGYRNGLVVKGNLLVWCLVGISQGTLSRQYHAFLSGGSNRAGPKLRIAEARQILNVIPPDDSVSAQVAFVLYLSHRRHLYTFPNPFLQKAWGNTVQARREIEMGAGSTCELSSFDHEISRAPITYIILCPSSVTFPLSKETLEASMLLLLKNHSYGIIAMGKYTVLFRKGANYRYGLHLLERASGARVVHTKDLDMAFWKWIGNQSIY